MGKPALKYGILGLALFITCNAMAQSIIVGQPISSSQNWFGVAYIDSNHPVISISPTTSAAGIPIPTVSNSDLFLRTSVYQKFYSRWGLGSIQAQISSGSVPSGTTLTAVSAPCTTTNSGGTLGNPAGSVVLTNSNNNLVTGISTSYTGTGSMDGYQITFTLSVSNYSQLVAGTYNVTVNFSISP